MKEYMCVWRTGRHWRCLSPWACVRFSVCLPACLSVCLSVSSMSLLCLSLFLTCWHNSHTQTPTYAYSLTHSLTHLSTSHAHISFPHPVARPVLAPLPGKHNPPRRVLHCACSLCSLHRPWMQHCTCEWPLRQGLPASRGRMDKRWWFTWWWVLQVEVESAWIHDCHGNKRQCVFPTLLGVTRWTWRSDNGFSGQNIDKRLAVDCGLNFQDRWEHSVHYFTTRSGQSHLSGHQLLHRILCQCRCAVPEHFSLCKCIG